ncbi:orotate phosphoribosyltransferase [Clostridiales bacterium KA00134]|nr:orotate phosphoribosyltransferase [Clostridiales bacterium KA00134]
MEKIMDILKETGAIMKGHFLLSSGRHADTYIQCAKVLQDPKKAEEVMEEIKKQVEDLNLDVIVGPAMGGVLPAYELARQLKVISMFTEREEGVVKLRRGFQIKPGQRVLVSEDVVTTGKSSLEAIRAIEALGAEVLGISCIINRSSKKTLDKYPIYSVISLDVDSFEEKDCPLCKQNKPIVKPGSRNMKK